MFVEARTVLARSRAHIARFVENIRAPAHTTLIFTLSSNAWDEGTAARLSAVASRSIGCVSAPLPSLDGMAALSYGFIRAAECTTFRWTQPAADSADDWAAQALGDAPPPKEGLLTADDEGNRAGVLTFSAKPESIAFHDELVRRFPRAAQIGLVASHTPFVNGRPFTLLRNGVIHSHGAVGLALRSTRPRISFSLDAGFRAISPPIKVASARGNIVHTLGTEKATRRLLRAIHDAGLDTENSKDDEFFIALFPSSASVPAETLGLEMHPEMYEAVLPIGSGDPSRGSIGIESEWGPSTGNYVQILHRAMSTPLSRNAKDAQMRFSTTTLEALHAGATRVVAEDVVELPDVLEACSENGFVILDDSRAPWACASPGVSVAAHSV